jgi:hypothetical protein
MNDRIPELDVLLGPVEGEEAALAEVRARVRQRIRRPQWPLWLAAAAMLAVALLAGWFAKRLNQPVETLTYALRAPEAPEVRLTLPPPVPVRRAVRKSTPAPVKNTEPIVVRLETDDPNVVILWLGD